MIVSPGPDERTVVDAAGRQWTAPVDWELLPPGDAALTRRVKAAGEFWAVQERRGRKVFSRGVWAPAETIARVRQQLDQERADPRHAQRQATARARRERQQDEYAASFRQAVLEFLGFAAPHADLAERLADAVALHATPVGSGTVARTQRIPVPQRAEAAVIAWLRHQTTAYDQMKIPRERGRRREVRRLLAGRSRELLGRYRSGEEVGADCPLAQALRTPNQNP